MSEVDAGAVGEAGDYEAPGHRRELLERRVAAVGDDDVVRPSPCRPLVVYARSVRDRGLVAAVGVHRVDLPAVAVATALEGDPGPIGRPRRTRVFHVRELHGARAVGVHHPDPGVVLARRLIEGDLRPVWRPGWVVAEPEFGLAAAAG